MPDKMWPDKVIMNVAGQERLGQGWKNWQIWTVRISLHEYKGPTAWPELAQVSWLCLMGLKLWGWKIAVGSRPRTPAQAQMCSQQFFSSGAWAQRAQVSWPRSARVFLSPCRPTLRGYWRNGFFKGGWKHVELVFRGEVEGKEYFKETRHCS